MRLLNLKHINYIETTTLNIIFDRSIDILK